MVQAFQAADEVIGQGILGISESLNLHQEMNLSLNDVSSTVGCRHGTLLAVGRGSGNDGPVQAAREALANPLLDRSFDMSTGALLMIKGGAGAMTMGGVDKARQVAANALGKEANIFVGVGVDETMGESVRLTLIAAGLQRGGDPPSTMKDRHS
jgi:cell division protein FtsZ